MISKENPAADKTAGSDTPSHIQKSSQLYRPRIQLVIPSLHREQLVMRPPLDDLALLEHHDTIRVAHGGESVGDDKRRTVFHQALHPVVDVHFGPRIDRTRRLVEHEDRRFGDGGTGNI